MTARDALHSWVETLSDEEAAAVVLSVTRHSTAGEQGADRMGAVPGAGFLSAASPDRPALAAVQGVRPVARFEDLLTNILPEDEDPDDIAATVRQWRQSGC